MRSATPLLLAVALVGSFFTRAGAAPPAASPYAKAPEITTIGSAPYVLTAAHRAKLAEGLRQYELRRATVSAPAAIPPGGIRVPAAMTLPKSAFLETREPAGVSRNRFKAGQPSAADATVLPAPTFDPATAKAKSVVKAGQP